VVWTLTAIGRLGRVVLIAPAGETAVLTVPEAERSMSAISDALADQSRELPASG
jgi:hypothetical protein